MVNWTHSSRGTCLSLKEKNINRNEGFWKEHVCDGIINIILVHQVLTYFSRNKSKISVTHDIANYSYASTSEYF